MKCRNRRRVWRWLGCFAGGAVVSFGGLIVAFELINRAMVSQTKSLIVSRADDVRPVTMAVVPGARIYSSGGLSAYLEDRVDRAVELYRAGKVQKLLMSGDNRSRYYDEPTAMRNYAISLGVPADDVLRDFAGLRTFDTMWRAKELWGQTEFIIVTQRFHLARSVYLAQSVGVKAQGFVADNRPYVRSTARRLAAREWLARGGAWFDVNVLRTQPRHSGERQGLSGLEQDTQVDEQRRAIREREASLDATSSKAKKE